jgi:hypothetical protein
LLNVNALTLFITLHFILELPWMDEPWRYVIYDAVMLIFAAITLVSQVRPCFCVWKVLRQILMVESNDLPRQARDMQKRTIERKGAPTCVCVCFGVDLAVRGPHGLLRHWAFPYRLADRHGPRRLKLCVRCARPPTCLPAYPTMCL